jgi:hypothetical protein
MRGGIQVKNINPEKRKAKMPKTKKNIKVRDQKPKADPKGGRQHRHLIRTPGGGGNEPGDRPVGPGHIIP